jgi:hypothetical protein
MTIEYYTAESNVSPSLVDSTSSQKYTYLRQNVQEVEREDPDGSKYTVYVYEEAKLTKEEYTIYLVDQTSGEANTQAQLAIAELAEQQETDKTALQEAIAELAEIVTTSTTA